MIEVIPAIIPQSLDDLKYKLGRVHEFVSLVQVDIIDGVYDNDINWPFNNDFSDFKQFENEEEGLPYWEDVDVEFDLMIKDPESKMLPFLKAGVSAVIIHYESTNNLEEAIKLAREYGVKVGLALKPSTVTDTIEPYLSEVDFIQFMGSDEIGRHNVEIDERLYTKISDFHNTYKNVILGVDIGVNFDTASKLKEVGVTRLVSGSAIFNAPDPEEAIKVLKQE